MRYFSLKYSYFDPPFLGSWLPSPNVTPCVTSNPTWFHDRACNLFQFWSLIVMAYCVFSLQVKSKLKGHQKRITGLAFSTSLNILVSSGADAQVSDYFLGNNFFWFFLLRNNYKNQTRENFCTVIFIWLAITCKVKRSFRYLICRIKRVPLLSSIECFLTDAKTMLYDLNVFLSTGICQSLLSPWSHFASSSSGCFFPA